MRKDAVRAYEIVYAALGGEYVEHLVGLDVGTTGVKALAITPTGDVVATAEESYPLSTPQPGWAEQDPEDWWRASEKALAALGVEPAGVGLSGQMHGLVCLDEGGSRASAGDPLERPAHGAECAEIEELVGLERLIALTGNRALPGFTAPKLLWLRRHEPDVYARIRHILLPKDYVRLRLTGEHATDVADASGTLLFDVAGRRWSRGGLQTRSTIPGEWLPPVHESPEIAGAGDQQAAALGVGAVEPGTLSVVLGTSGVVFAALAEFRADPAGPRARVLPRRPRSLGGDGRDAERGRRAAVVPRRVRARRRVRRPRRGGGAWEPGAEGLLFLPYLQGERTPHADPDARGAFAGLSLRHDRGALVRSVLEGVAYGLRDSLELLRALGVEPARGAGRPEAEPAAARGSGSSRQCSGSRSS